jgi:peptidyl-prolyl cis-trans isomerase SurA
LFFRILLISVVILFAILLESRGKGEIVDRIVAIINEDIITLSELDAFRKSFFPDTPQSVDWLNEELDLLEARHRALDTLIEEKLIDQEADRQRITVTQRELNDTLESLRQEKGFTQSQLETALKAQGLNLEEYTERVKRGLRKAKLVNLTIKSTIEMEEEDLKSYYRAHVNDYMIDESIRINHILLPLNSGATKEQEEAALSMANDILRRVENGEDFDGLAYEYSQGVPGAGWGDLGYFKRGEMLPALEKTAFGLTVGEVSGAVRTDSGVVLVKVTEKKGGTPLSFTEVREKVERDYYGSEVQRRFREWLDELRERAFIEVKL